MLKRKKTKEIKIKNEYEGDYSDIDNRWLNSENKTGFFDDLINTPEGCLIVWSMYEDRIYAYDNSLKWIKFHGKEMKRGIRGV